MTLSSSGVNRSFNNLYLYNNIKPAVKPSIGQQVLFGAQKPKRRVALWTAAAIAAGLLAAGGDVARFAFLDSCRTVNQILNGVAWQGGHMTEDQLLLFASPIFSDADKAKMEAEAFKGLGAKPDENAIPLTLPMMHGEGHFTSKAYFIPANPNASIPEGRKKIILYAAGADGDFRTDRQLFRRLQAQGFNILAIPMTLKDDGGKLITEYSKQPTLDGPPEKRAEQPLFESFLSDQYLNWSKKIATEGIEVVVDGKNVKLKIPYPEQGFSGRSSGAQRAVEAMAKLAEEQKVAGNPDDIVTKINVVLMPTHYERVLTNLRENEASVDAKMFASIIDFFRDGVSGGLGQIKGRFDERKRLEQLLRQYPQIHLQIVEGTKDSLVGRDDRSGQNMARALYTHLTSLFPGQVQYVSVEDGNHNDSLFNPTPASQAPCAKIIPPDYDLQEKNTRISGLSTVFSGFFDPLGQWMPYFTIAKNGTVNGYQNPKLAPFYA